MPERALCPEPWRVRSVIAEGDDTVSLLLDPPPGRDGRFEPGQFNMLYAFGIGEVPISFSGDPAAGEALHTVRAVGAVSRALCALRPGDAVGVRGPYGTAWPLDEARGRDVLVVAGGIGLAPLRGLVCRIAAERDAFGRAALLVGARTPAGLLYPADRARWAERLDVLATVDHADVPWDGPVGVVPSLVPRVRFDPSEAVAFVCGPEVMMRFTAEALIGAGIAPARIHVSLERNMQCAVGTCGHCQLATELVCRDGAVFTWARVAPLLAVKEL